jgi:hypothetical protein
MHAVRRPFSNIERNVHASASRRAKKQLMEIPWNRFRPAYEAYPEWQGLSLWIRTIVTDGQFALPQVLGTLRKKCPGFLATGASTAEPNLLGFRLLEWVHGTVFRHARREGWLDALTFYGVRHVRSEAYWALWERYENERSKAAIRVVTTFEKWKQLALAAKAASTLSYSEAERALEKYIDLEATAQWVQPLLTSDARLPKHIVSELKKRVQSDGHPATLGSAEKREARFANPRLVIRAAKRRCLRGGAGEGCQEKLLTWARSHPWHMRLLLYGRLWSARQFEKRTTPYPTLRQWQAAAELYVTHDD